MEVHQPKQQCDESEFPDVMDGKQCYGLREANATGFNECRDACCQARDCEIWQFCSAGAGCGKQACWIGKASGCGEKQGWVSRSRQLIRRPSDLCDDSRCTADLDDSKWRPVGLPHDFVIEQGVKEGTDSMHGYREYGVGWYRKHFRAPNLTAENAYAWLEFDGIYRNSQIWLNGKYIGGQASGYTSFAVPLSQHLRYGQDNVLAVRSDAKTELEGWFYEGGGIYRHVRFVSAPTAHVHDLFLAPNVDPTSISDDGRSGTAEVNATFEVLNSGDAAFNMIVIVSLFNMNRMKVGYQEKILSVSPNEVLRTSVTFSLYEANLWGTEHPYLYTAKVELFKNQEVVDSMSKPFGARHVRWDKDKGLFINNLPVKLKGFCNHQDFGGVGVAVPDRINQWKVKKLQEMGSNAWRMSHGPPNPELLDFTDELGMLVMDEHRSYCQHHQMICNETGFLEDLRRMIRRDRNHPSVIMWSFCNEAGCSNHPNDEYALTTAFRMKQVVQAEDPVNTRPVTGGWYSQWAGLTQGWSTKVMDVQGINYYYNILEQFHKEFPNKPMLSSETASCYSARGVYFTNATAGQLDAYSTYQCTEDWVKSMQPDYISGAFGWTGFDYHGEPMPTFWPAVTSNFGVIDVAGFPKDTFFWHQAWWTKKDVLHLLPHWNAPAGFTEDQSCDSSGFPVSLDGKQCFGLRSSPASSLNACAEACCNDVTCEAYSWNKHGNNCYHGKLDMNMCDDSPTWTGRGRRKVVKVWAFSNAHQVELSLNGISFGKQEVPHLEKVEWRVPYEPGTLRAVGYNINGQVVSEKVVETTGAPAKLRLEVEQGHGRLKADGADAGLVAVSVLDEAGRVVPTATNKIQFSVSGVGRILGGHNGNPTSHEPDVGSSWSLYNGWARVVVGASKDAGSLVLTATSPGLQEASVEIKMISEKAFCQSSMSMLQSSCSSSTDSESLPTSLLQQSCPYPSWYQTECI